MSRVYLAADENAAGVTVEDSGEGWIRITTETEFDPHYKDYTDAEARTVVEGLLRRMLEREGGDVHKDSAVITKVYGWMLGYLRSVGR